MADPRDAIMARLLEIADAVEGVRYTDRNNLDISDNKQPAIVLLEGDEQADEDDPRGRPASAPRRITMTPQVVILRGTSVSELGPDLNILRSRLIRDVCTDSALAALSLNGHSVRYIGMQSDFAFGRQMLGRMAVMFGITYALKPTDL